MELEFKNTALDFCIETFKLNFQILQDETRVNIPARNTRANISANDISLVGRELLESEASGEGTAEKRLLFRIPWKPAPLFLCAMPLDEVARLIETTVKLFEVRRRSTGYAGRRRAVSESR